MAEEQEPHLKHGMNWNILRFLPTYFLHLALAWPLPQEKLTRVLSPTLQKLENCLEIDLAQVEELKKQFQNDFAFNERVVSSDPYFGLLEEDWRRLNLLQSRLPEGSLLKKKLTHAFRLLIAALYQAHEALVSTEIGDQEMFHTNDMSETDARNRSNINNEDAEPQSTVLFDHTSDNKLNYMTTTESSLNSLEESEIDNEPAESDPKQYVVNFANYSEPTGNSNEEKTIGITDTSEAPISIELVNENRVSKPTQTYQRNKINSIVELTSTRSHSTQTLKPQDTMLDLRNTSLKPPIIIPPQVVTLNKDKLNITKGSADTLNNEDETDVSLANTVMTVATTREGKSLSSFTSFSQSDINFEDKPSSAMEDITSANNSILYTTPSITIKMSSWAKNSSVNLYTTPSTTAASNLHLSPHNTSNSVFISPSQVPITTPSFDTIITDSWENISAHNVSTTSSILHTVPENLTISSTGNYGNVSSQIEPVGIFDNDSKKYWLFTTTSFEINTAIKNDSEESDSRSNESDENSTTSQDINSSQETVFSVPFKTLESEKLSTIVSELVTDPTQQITREEFEGFQKEESSTEQTTSKNILEEELGESTSTVTTTASIIASISRLETDNNTEIPFSKSSSEKSEMDKHLVNLFSSTTKRDYDDENTTPSQDINSSQETVFSVPSKTLVSEKLSTIIAELVTDPTQQITREEFEGFQKEESSTEQTTSKNILEEELGESISTILLNRLPERSLKVLKKKIPLSYKPHQQMFLRRNLENPLQLQLPQHLL
ncbi:uncharacterized protein LOC124355368 [Homalodisca vitripennis]|uniref:uncharacterized protein LOC124355368 n=1 Tax=Homalodisca vitripennis TaxID=197043 RepID=UPI001EEB827A|nr:uncharacterized protein LOC124355368 [Homalodisca vitripennis]